VLASAGYLLRFTAELSLKEFGKSVGIWRSYVQTYSETIPIAQFLCHPVMHSASATTPVSWAPACGDAVA